MAGPSHFLALPAVKLRFKEYCYQSHSEYGYIHLYNICSYWGTIPIVCVWANLQQQIIIFQIIAKHNTIANNRNETREEIKIHKEPYERIINYT